MTETGITVGYIILLDLFEGGTRIGLDEHGNQYLQPERHFFQTKEAAEEAAFNLCVKNPWYVGLIQVRPLLAVGKALRF